MKLFVEFYFEIKYWPMERQQLTRPQQWRSLPVVVGVSCDGLRAGIGMTITLPVHPMSVTQYYYNLE